MATIGPATQLRRICPACSFTEGEENLKKGRWAVTLEKKHSTIVTGPEGESREGAGEFNNKARHQELSVEKWPCKKTLAGQGVT